MIKFLFLSAIITPPIMYLIMFLNITDQDDGRTKRDAQIEVLKRTVKSPLVWLWIIFILIMGLLASGDLPSIIEGFTNNVARPFFEWWRS